MVFLPGRKELAVRMRCRYNRGGRKAAGVLMYSQYDNEGATANVRI